MIKLLILGPTGFTSKLITSLAIQDEEIEVIAACDVNRIGEKLSKIMGLDDKNQVIIQDVSILEKVIDETQPDVVVDFTLASATEKNCLICVEKGVRCVIGTTALSASFLEKFKNKVKEKNAPAVISSNMATGMNVFSKIASILAKYLSEWDIEIIESHHNRKLDVPSGTSLMIGKKICETIGCEADKTLKVGRDKGPNKRKVGARKEIGIHAIRGGDIVGDHVVLFAGVGERIEIKHQAHSRACFAEGAIKAIKFVSKTTKAMIFNTNDVLGI